MGDMTARFRRMIAPLEARIRGVVSRGTISGVTDTTRAQELQVRLLAGEIRSVVEHLQTYGFSSSPPLGAEVVVVFPGGSREHGIAVGCVDRATRPTGLATGDASVHVLGGTTYLLLQPALERATLQGDEIRLDAFDDIEASVGTSKIKVTTTEITLEAGGSKITVNAAGITLKGAAINLDT